MAKSSLNRSRVSDVLCTTAKQNPSIFQMAGLTDLSPKTTQPRETRPCLGNAGSLGTVHRREVAATIKYNFAGTSEIFRMSWNVRGLRLTLEKSSS